MTIRIFVPRDAGAVAVGADEVALALEQAADKRGLTIEIVAPARAACTGWSRWSRSRRRRAASPTARSTAADVGVLLDAMAARRRRIRCGSASPTKSPG